MLRSCTTCGRIFPIDGNRKCPACRPDPNAPRSPGRDRSAQQRFRRALIKRAGKQCEETDRLTGLRCTETTDLRACHLTPLSDGGTNDPANGKLRCARHDRETDRYAR